MSTAIFGGGIEVVGYFDPYAAVIPQIDGSAYITDRHEFLIDPDDPLKEGFMVR